MEPTVFVDKLFPTLSSQSWPYTQACHLLCYPDQLESLNAFARKLGLRPAWLQSRPVPHYDLTPSKRIKAIQAGAVELRNRQEVVRILRAWKAENKNWQPRLL